MHAQAASVVLSSRSFYNCSSCRAVLNFPGSCRSRARVGLLLFFTVGEFLLVALAVGLPAWGHLALVAGAINIAAMLLYPFIPESARWLLSQGKQQQATELLQAIAAANGGHMPQQPLVCSKDTNCSKDTATICSYSNSDVPDSSGKPADGSSSDGQARLGLLSLLQNRSLFIRSAVLFVTWYALMQVGCLNDIGPWARVDVFVIIPEATV
eukprot:GHRQ01033663.1.p1 GENE.GHRQ01033663.1~~GHRQ01033663.1.p1  ORF type:complete len:211 (-),score=47.02 GHRQ01033663.1:679-1311(-)